MKLVILVINVKNFNLALFCNQILEHKMENSSGGLILKEEKHHQQQELCTTRPAYRQGRNLTAVKVYTINSESQHLFIYGVPSINLRTELKSLCSKYGKLICIHIAQNYKTELFTECFHVHYERIQSARIAKRLIDNKSFYGGILHVCYAPEYDSLEETGAKLLQRINDVRSRIDDGSGMHISQRSKISLEKFSNITKSQIRKRKRLGTLQEEETFHENKHFKNDSSTTG